MIPRRSGTVTAAVRSWTRSLSKMFLTYGSTSFHAVPVACSTSPMLGCGCTLDIYPEKGSIARSVIGYQRAVGLAPRRTERRGGASPVLVSVYRGTPAGFGNDCFRRAVDITSTAAFVCRFIHAAAQ